jgi:hypothetical protein
LEESKPQSKPQKQKVKKTRPPIHREQKKKKDEFSKDAALGMTTAELGTKFNLGESSVGVYRKNLARQIEKEVRARLGTVSLKSLDNLVSLAFGAESEQVRYVATKDLLDRAGFKATELSKVEIEDRRNRTPVEIEGEMRERFGNDVADMIMGRAKVINGESAGADVSRPEGDSLDSSVPVPATRIN